MAKLESLAHNGMDDLGLWSRQAAVQAPVLDRENHQHVMSLQLIPSMLRSSRAEVGRRWRGRRLSAGRRSGSSIPKRDASAFQRDLWLTLSAVRCLRWLVGGDKAAGVWSNSSPSMPRRTTTAERLTGRKISQSRGKRWPKKRQEARGRQCDGLKVLTHLCTRRGIHGGNFYAK